MHHSYISIVHINHLYGSSIIYINHQYGSCIMHIHDPYVSCIARSQKKLIPGVEKWKKSKFCQSFSDFFWKSRVLESSKKLIDEVQKKIDVFETSKRCSLIPQWRKWTSFIYLKLIWSSFFKNSIYVVGQPPNLV